MSAQLFSDSGPDGNHAGVQGTTVGGSKPLHRFMKGQPKIVGVVVLILGTSFFILCVSIEFAGHSLWTVMPTGVLLGALLVICGILYIVTEHFPTKKTVTISLALSIVATLASFWSLLHIVPELGSLHYNRYSSSDFEENSTETETESLWVLQYESMAVSLVAVFVFYSLAATVILIVMSSMAGAALRSTKTQAIVVMTTAAPGTPAE